MNVLAHNLTAMNAERMYGVNARLQMKTSEKLSSGYKINRSADDAAGLSISEKMRRQVRGLTQASANAQDGISMVQIADGALTEVHDMLQRSNELVIKAANGTLSDGDREDINKELVQLRDAIDQISTNTKFNELEVFPATGVAPELASATVANKYELEFGPDGIASIKHTAQGEGAGSLSAIKTGNALADKIAGEYVPNAVDQIFNTFGSLKDEIENKYKGDAASKLKMGLDIKYVDGPGGTLAYVQASFKVGDQTLSKMSMTVDSADFSEDDVKNDTSKLGVLESTIAHEMMHAVMDAAMPSRMYRNGGAEDFPKWYVEGSAQLSGGGYTTGWNDELKNIVKNAPASKQDEMIKKYLKTAGTVDNREYGHGYLAAAYLGQLISGQAEVSAANIAKGTDDLFKELLKDENGNKSFEEVANKLLQAAGSSMTLAKVKNAINTGADGGVAFVKELTTKSLDGAGSVIAADGLGAPAKKILGDGEVDPAPPIQIDTSNIKVENLFKDPASGFYDVLIQAGSESDVDNKIMFNLFRMTSKDLGLDAVGIVEEETGEGEGGDAAKLAMLTEDGATEAIDIFKKAINLVSGVRSYYGAVQNRMEHTIRNLDNVVENTTASEARLRDTDMAAEMVKYARDNILLQAGHSMMAQANQSNSGLLSLLSR